MQTNTHNLLKVLMELCDFKPERITDIMNAEDVEHNGTLSFTPIELDRLISHKGGTILRLNALKYISISGRDHTMKVSGNLEDYLISENITRLEKAELSMSIQDDYEYHRRMKEQVRLSELLAYIESSTNITAVGDIQKSHVWLTLSSNRELSSVVTSIISAEVIPFNKMVIYRDVTNGVFNIVLNDFMLHFG